VFGRVYGSDHYEVAVNLNNLAALRQAGGDAREAEELYRRALALKEKLRGANHPDVAVTANNLAVLYKHQGRYADAERLYRRALTTFECSFGVSHPNQALSRSSNVLGEQIVDEGLIAQPSPLRLPSHRVENLGIDPNGNQSPGLGTQRRSPHASHRSQMGGGNLRDFGEVNPGTPPCTPLALSGSPGARG
jgi:hypothetical protein